MENITFKISNECIGCKACVNVAQDNWGMSGSKAFVKKQPENEEEIKLCKQAMKVCPVNAISSEQGDSNITPVLSKSNIKATLDKHPQLKQILFDLSPKFRKLQNPAMYNTLARFATFEDAARLSGMSICEILHTLNKAIGTDKKLAASMPECISKNQTEDILTGEEITWEESSERYIYNNDTAPELIQKISHILPEQNIVIISVDKPDLVLKTAEGLNFKYSIEQNKEYRVSIFNPQKEQKLDWKDRKEEFDVLDVRSMMTDPFDIIIKKAYGIEEDGGFVLVQQFEPFPLINMLNEMGFESITEKKTPNEVRVYFHKKQIQKNKSSEDKDKPSVVIQSATPVAYPVIMRLLQSEKIRSSITIKELKVWEETEKHLGWIVNGKADISFSALITSVKLKDVDVKLPAMFVWDNFYILTRDHNAKNLKDLSGKKIYTPLFEEAPPAKITNYIIRAKGLNPDDFKLVFGEPFGRPEIIYRDFITGKAETVILREPEASYAIKAM
ncbi:ferredoxin, partial [bacterium]|nr:ferredoxin [bacterium]